MDMKSVGGDFKVCLCRSKTKDEILAYIKDNNIKDVKSLKDGFNVGNKCGACTEDLESLISMAWENELKEEKVEEVETKEIEIKTFEKSYYVSKKILPDMYFVGANDRRLSMFEGVYSVPKGVSYNSYLILDDKTILFDTVDKAVSNTFFKNVESVLEGRELDYLVIQHMEPDHSATLMELLSRYKSTKIICNEMVLRMIDQFFNIDLKNRAIVVKDKDTFTTGRHTYKFFSAPMVHWPEVMMTYENENGILFSADAFGTFGALNGAIFSDEVDFENEYMDEARRYYANIVGKYGMQVQEFLKKIHQEDIKMICPLHGFVWRRKIESYFDKYVKWSTYTPEEIGVVIPYASVYGNTERVAEMISSRLRDLGVTTKMYDVSVTPASEIISACFKYSHMVFCSTTYNAGIFISMEELLNDLRAHNIQNRTVAFVENGSWAPTSGNLMKDILKDQKNIKIIDKMITLKSSLKPNQEHEIDELVSLIYDTIPKLTSKKLDSIDVTLGEIDKKVFKNFSYGLFIVTSKLNEKMGGCIINTAIQLTSNPSRVLIAVNKENFTHDLIMGSGIFNLSFLSEKSIFDTYKHFGFKSGKEVEKFGDDIPVSYSISTNGLPYIKDETNSYLSAKVINSYDYGSHTLFIAEVTEAEVLNDDKSVTYSFYFDNIKPKKQEKLEEVRHGYVCKICGYFYEGDTLPDDFICPLCKHPASDFEKI